MKCSPSRVWLIYVIMFTTSFAAFSMDPLSNQYIYQKIAESYNTTSKQSGNMCGNSSSDDDILVSQKASSWNLYFNTAMWVPAGFAGVIITSWGDKVGRKIAMAVILLGMTAAQLSFALISWFQWPLPSLFVISVLYGLVGYYTTFFMQGVAYLGDITEPEDRGKMFVIIETFLGLGGGIGGIASGYWLTASGYVQPVMFSVLLDVISFILLFFLPDSFLIREALNKKQKEKDSTEREGSFISSFNSCHSDVTDLQIPEKQCLLSEKIQATENNITDVDAQEGQATSFRVLLRAVWSVYSSEYSHCEKCHGANKENFTPERCPHGGGLYPGRVWRIWFYLVSYGLFLFSFNGVLQFQTIYNLSPPLCFSPVLIGAQSGMAYTMVALSPFFVMVYQRVLHCSNDVIILIGLLTFVVGTTAMSFATVSYIVFIACFIRGLSNPATPFIQAQVSNMVSESEQGSALGLLSFSEIINSLLSAVVFLTVYPATEKFFNGFIWLFAACFGVVSFILILIIIVKNRKSRRSEGGDREPFMS